ncbi:LysM and putative peptidoglycan-binding domain-containing protein 1 [Liparis tanakae]|uniref:LysM and putative peptidoglycan-binding domain-containing protein 1 n=1 Tax=Liparis tanakae TaxID=230148 RepID=A0A4Z2FKZ8_9TELE|nr:LysM and putative peptidoglycan-binding domain-containing protein 1 [Liparis tanakae]
MSEERAPPPAGANGLLRGSRTRSYGSLVRSPLSPVRQRRVEHRLQPEDTLQGLSLKYGVSTEQIKRANRLYTNESIFLKKSLVAAIEAACSSGTSDWRPLTRSQSAVSSPRMQQQQHIAVVPLAVIKLTKKLRDREDEIFQL